MLEYDLKGGDFFENVAWTWDREQQHLPLQHKKAKQRMTGDRN